MFPAPPFRKAGCQFDHGPIIAIAQIFMREQRNLEKKRGKPQRLKAVERGDQKENMATTK